LSNRVGCTATRHRVERGRDVEDVHGRDLSLTVVDAEDGGRDGERVEAQGEDAVKEAFADATIVKPGWMYGHEDRLLNTLAVYVSPRVEPAVYIVLSAVATSRTCTGAILV
jgi:hypothetical protein